MYTNLLSTILGLLFLLGSSCQGPDLEEPYFDKDIPPSDAFDAMYGVWSPDGTQIAFQHDEPLSGDPDPGKLDQLWIYDTQTGERRKVIDGRVLNIDWSPDGVCFVFHTFTDPEYIFKVRADGTELTRLTGEGSPNNLKYTSVARWSPDGSQILFAVIAGEPRGASLMNPDGTDARIIIPYGVGARWFPNGNKIVYANWDTSVEDASRRRQIYIANADGSDIQKLTDLPDSDLLSEPNVSPDGRKIAFVHRGRDTSTEIFVMNADGTNIEQLTEGEGIAGRPEWHPDGRTILFSRFIPNVSERMYLLDVQTREVVPVFPAK